MNLKLPNYQISILILVSLFIILYYLFTWYEIKVPFERDCIYKEPREQTVPSGINSPKSNEVVNKKLSFVPCQNKPLNWNEFKQKILKSDVIYETINSTNAQVDPGGHGHIDVLFAKLFNKVVSKKREDNVNYIRIIEVGSFKGRSATVMGKACQNATKLYNISCDIICVDTWLGSPWHYEVDTQDFMGKNQFLNLYTTFLKNMVLSGLSHMVHTLRLPSAGAAHVLHCFKIDADMIYIDADHDYEDVLRDLRLYYSLLKKNGIIFGDDYTTMWPSVKYAVNDFTKEMQLEVSINDGRWFIQKTDEDSKFL